ncbi:hypothetical protein [Aurantimonas sp. VKM B-3413]|uniref:hypothetical protein n=1 Tax=Aurantimonas sp. VKM B-3413 TaxID=2779401 RepID=UPI001E3EFA01|nr:hypothetical protein [Aurantimonas sp. VKM B-3413]MCB8839492.1 hypothetical protein [Aurantimonas sp. VKM B-3413]
MNASDKAFWRIWCRKRSAQFISEGMKRAEARRLAHREAKRRAEHARTVGLETAANAAVWVLKEGKRYTIRVFQYDSSLMCVDFEAQFSDPQRYRAGVN